VARVQWGVFSREQAGRAGLERGAIEFRLESGEWERMLPCVYRATSAPVTQQQRLLAGCLWAGSGAVVSHMTAARLHGLEGVGQPRRGEPIELTVPVGKYLVAPGYSVHRSRKLERADRTVIGGIPATSFARTLTDLASVLDERHLSLAMDSGLSRYPHIDVPYLRRQLRRLATRRGTGARTLGKLLDARATNAVDLDSELERRFSAALREAGFPRPEEHYQVIESGRRLGEVDFAYPRARVAIELDGSAIHRRPDVWERDHERTSELAAAGWRVVTVTWRQLERDEEAVLQRLRRTLATTG
jgi:hypothetical protein